MTKLQLIRSRRQGSYNAMGVTNMTIGKGGSVGEGSIV